MCVFSIQHTYGVQEPSCSASVSVIRCTLAEDETAEWLNLSSDAPADDFSVIDFEFFDDESLVVVYKLSNVAGAVEECSGRIEADHEVDRPG